MPILPALSMGIQGVGVVAAILVVVALALVVPVHAQGDGGDTPPVREVTDDEVNAISHQLYCPVCENVPLDVCGTPACIRWRAQVRTLLEGGASEAEVVDYFVEQFGQRVVGEPLDPALSFLSWAVPAGAVIIGLAVFGIVLLRWRAGDADPVLAVEVVMPEGPALTDDDYRARLERELRMLE
jgi:cytochrome c-type biogenesis protein CcmH